MPISDDDLRMLDAVYKMDMEFMCWKMWEPYVITYYIEKRMDQYDADRAAWLAKIPEYLKTATR